MKIDDVRRNAYAMPLTSPAFPPGPYRFKNREYMVITYRTDPAALRAVVPEPLQIAGDGAGGAIVKVILECALLTDDEKRRACRMAVEAGAQFVKTSTGFASVLNRNPAQNVGPVERFRLSR